VAAIPKNLKKPFLINLPDHLEHHFLQKSVTLRLTQKQWIESTPIKPGVVLMGYVD
jgi:hypothetical protein